MPYSTTLYKEQVKNHILSRLHESAKILDVGAGAGTYSHLIREKFKNIDAVEIFGDLKYLDPRFQRVHH